MSDDQLREYLAKNSVIIVDSVSAARVNLASSLARLGAVRQKMSLVGTMDEARAEIAKTKPKLIFTDYEVGKELGLDLIQNQKVSYTQEYLKDSMFILVTGNASQSAVARAAEEDVDTYIIKPYTFETLKKALNQTMEQKLHPSKYLELIEKGKVELFSRNFDEAIHFFGLAMHEHSTPTLACFYSGQAEYMKLALASAETKYKKGLSYNKIHYKCLVGLFDLLNDEKKYQEAYEVIRVIAQYFPANPKRLASVLRLSVITENYLDIDGYYRVFLEFDVRKDELVKTMCSALLVSGKFFLRKNDSIRASIAFEAAAVSSAGRTQFLLYIIDALVSEGMESDALKYLDRLSKISTESHDYLAAKFLISTLSGEAKDSLSYGRRIIHEGVMIPAVHEKMISLSMKTGYPEAAHELYQSARDRWPDRAEDFASALGAKLKS